MKTKGTIFTVAGESLMLLPEKAIYWERKEALFIADLHLGKSGHFRKSGIPVSSKVHVDDLNRLTFLLQQWKVTTLYLLGDLFHSIHNSEWDDFLDWRMRYPDTGVHLVKGNHDILDERLMQEGNIILHRESCIVDPFFLSHQPVEISAGTYYQIHGHIHPGVRLKGKGLQSLSFPCYRFGQSAAVLPAFGGFTGHVMLQPAATDVIFIVYDRTVRQMDGGLGMEDGGLRTEDLRRRTED